MSTACDLLFSSCGPKDHNSPSCSSDQSTSINSAGNAASAARRREKCQLLQSLKHLLRVQRRPMSSPPLPERVTAAVKPQVYVVGSPNPKSPFLRIAHISDTCDLQDSGRSVIYEADVLVHSGNLCGNQFRKHFFRDADFVNQLKAINDFFAALPHRHKIFVPGPNEAFADPDDRERIQALLPSCIYLHDSGCIIEGVRFHGVSQGCTGRRFGRSLAEMKTAWSNVPDTVDVLVSHSMPTNSLYDDLVARLRPKMLLYGCRLQRSSRTDQPADENCVKFKDNIIFSNGHAGNACKRGLFDFYADDQVARETHIPQVPPAAVSEAYRSLPTPASGRPGLLRCILS